MRLAAAAVLLAFTCAESGDAPGRAAAPGVRPQYDLIIAGGDVVDGTGRARVHADVGIRGDSIAKIGDLSKATATTRLDARGRIVSPGFIDLLGNSQAAVLIDPNLEGKIRQGVTTEVTGEGHSPGPLSEAMAAEMQRTRPKGWPDVTWRTLGEFMSVVEKHGTALNFAFYLGAANPREMVLGDGPGDPTPEQLARMQKIVDQAMNDGAVGVASALIYPPGSYAKTAELTALAKRSYWTHLRSESSKIDDAIEEAIRIGRDAHVPVNLFHLKIGGRENWGRMPEVVARIERARKSGVDVASCVYPYTATSTELTSIVPAWALEGGYLQLLARLKEPAKRTRIADALRAGRLQGDGASTIVVRGAPSRKLDELAKEMHVDAAEALLRVFEQNQKSPIGIYFSLSEDDMKAALNQPWVAVCSDSGAVVGEFRQ
ncbi:MAG TPA: D-aminoacylase, partial [Thermoanaerobaculia bacterium]|nr:D-aminoacylase [Thermoanaerobaculia bacterium]